MRCTSCKMCYLYSCNLQRPETGDSDVSKSRYTSIHTTLKVTRRTEKPSSFWGRLLFISWVKITKTAKTISRLQKIQNSRKLDSIRFVSISFFQESKESFLESALVSSGGKLDFVFILNSIIESALKLMNESKRRRLLCFYLSDFVIHLQGKN